jgi:hypothetical protein
VGAACKANGVEAVQIFGRDPTGNETTSKERYKCVCVCVCVSLRWILLRYYRVMWAVLVWLRIGTSGKLL